MSSLDSEKIENLDKIKKSPCFLRVAHIKREEEWISGSELKTDNSSSDDEMSPTNSSTITGALKMKKVKTKKKKKFNKMMKNEIDDDCHQIERRISKGDVMVKINVNPCVEEEEKDDETFWRPKRGSITLPDVIAQIDKLKVK